MPLAVIVRGFVMIVNYSKKGIDKRGYREYTEYRVKKHTESQA
jgi:hypothetical protein